MKYLLLLPGLFLLAMGCKHEPANQHEELRPEIQEQLAALPALTTAQGTTLLETQCYTCHNPSSDSHDNMLAPPMAGVKYRYGQLHAEREVFIQRMTDFIAHPSEDNAVMRGPVRRFGLMPPTTLPPDTILALAAYIHDHELPVPDWFPEHFEEEHGKSWQSSH